MLADCDSPSCYKGHVWLYGCWRYTSDTSCQTTLYFSRGLKQMEANRLPQLQFPCDFLTSRCIHEVVAGDMEDAAGFAWRDRIGRPEMHPRGPT